MPITPPSDPKLIHIADLEVNIGNPIEVGETPVGNRRVIPIIGGKVSGPRLAGRILDAGADFQLIRPDGVTELHAQYVIETEHGARIYIENSGIRQGSPEAMKRLLRGEAVNPDSIYFRTTPKFETAASDYAWLMKHIFVASGARYPDRVDIRIFQVS